MRKTVSLQFGRGEGYAVGVKPAGGPWTPSGSQLGWREVDAVGLLDGREAPLERLQVVVRVDNVQAGRVRRVARDACTQRDSQPRVRGEYEVAKTCSHKWEARLRTASW